MKRIGIVAHSVEGGGLCFLTACREGQALLGPHMHPEIVVSAIPMGLSMPGWESGEHNDVAEALARGVEQVAQAGADFFICPDNTAHIVLEEVAPSLPIPGLHIARVVCEEAVRNGWQRPGLLGTKWTMTGPVYPRALSERSLAPLIPDEATMLDLDRAIFDELCQGMFITDTTQRFIGAIDALQRAGADCVILGCTEIPLIISPANSPLPPLDSTRLLAKYAVALAVSDDEIRSSGGWVDNTLVVPALYPHAQE